MAAIGLSTSLREMLLGNGGFGNDPVRQIAPRRFQQVHKENCSRALRSRQERGGFGRRRCSGEDRLKMASSVFVREHDREDACCFFWSPGSSEPYCIDSS
jgi:hypothetical protein